jgi:AcrR family transcriptional regulator
MEVFWKSGYAATTLDDISAATGMNRPSLYAAFGDKREIYEKAYRRYRAELREEFRPILEADQPIGVVLRRVLEASAELYLSGARGPRGCLTVVTAGSEAIADAEIGRLVIESITAIDAALAAVFAKARTRGELPASSDPRALGRVASATLHTLSIRARAGCPREELWALIDDAIGVMCGAE